MFLAKYGANPVTIASATFSVISVVVTLLAVKTQFNLFAKRQRVLVQFTVHGLTLKDRKLQLQTRMIAKEFANLLGLHHDLVYIEQPRGFRFKVNLYVNYSQYHDENYEDLMEAALRDGTLIGIFMRNWNLNVEPEIKDFKYNVMQSDLQKKNTVHIVMKQHIYSNSQVVQAEGVSIELPMVPSVVQTPFDAVQSSIIQADQSESEESNQSMYANSRTPGPLS